MSLEQPVELQPVELHHEVVYARQTALQQLQQHKELSTEQIMTCFAHGAVWLQRSGKPARLYDHGQIVVPGQKLHLYCNSSTLTACPFTPQLVDDQTQFSIWNKPSGMLSQGSKWGQHWTIHHWIRQHVWPRRECLITHRLDRFTRGLMIVAHDDSTNRQFHRLFESRKIQKTYRAIVAGEMEKQRSLVLDSPVDGRSARTLVRVLDSRSEPARSLLQVTPETGRKHQIRIHLAAAGHPVVNDRLYGTAPFAGDLMLQASALDFTHPARDQSLHVEIPTDSCISL